MTKIFITGIHGFVGQNLARDLRRNGSEVRGSSRHPQAPEVVPLALGDLPEPGLFRGFDCVVHAAWDLRETSRSLNLQGTTALASRARDDGVPRQIFLSSHSAAAEAPTSYGATKFATEAFFADLPGSAVLRPGLVVGNGGLYWRLREWVRSHRLIPLVGGGHFPVPFISTGDLAAVIGKILATPASEPALSRLYHPQVPTQRELVHAICQQTGWRRIRVTVPAAPTLFVLRAAQRLRLPLPVNAANLKSALANDAVPQLSDLLRFVPSPSSLPEAIRLAEEAQRSEGAIS